MPFIDIGRTRVHYYVHDNMGSEKPAIVFVHGAGGSGEIWRYQLDKIREYNLIALDLPGHGKSEGEAADSIKEYCESVRLFTEALDLKRFVIAGHSMGGAISLEAALTYPEVLEGLIIINSGARLRVNPKIFDKLAGGEHPLEFVNYYYSECVSSKTLELARQEMKAVPAKVLLNDFRACNDFNLMESIKTIRHQALIICGTDDRMTPVKYSELLAESLSLSNLVLIQNAGHMSMIERPLQVNKAIVDFMAGIH